jgi:hypothetical protein
MGPLPRRLVTVVTLVRRTESRRCQTQWARRSCGQAIGASRPITFVSGNCTQANHASLLAECDAYDLVYRSLNQGLACSMWPVNTFQNEPDLRIPSF